jgi:hypothetical protein
MASMVGVFRTDDYEDWKRMFDSDPVGRKEVAKGHRVMRSVDDPNEIFLRVDFGSVDEAKEFRERVLASGVLDRLTMVKEPTVVDVADEATY